MKHVNWQQLNWSKGEVSPELEARPDLAQRFNAARTIENFWINQEGGLTKRPGTKFLCEVKNSAQFTRLIPFVYTSEDSFLLEFGLGYIRFIKNRVRIMNGPIPYEIASPYTTNDLRDIHHEQSSDYMFLTSLRTNLDIQKLARIEDTDWEMANFDANPPPTHEALTDISGGTATLTPGGTTGSSVTFTASAPVFYLSDVSRNIVFGTASAVISVVAGGGTTATCTIQSAFPNTNPIPAGEWFLDGSPKAKIDPAHKGPVGKESEMITDIQAFRPADLYKYIRVYDGIMKIFNVESDVKVTGLIVKELSAWTDTQDPENPAETAAGAWRLEEPEWSPTNGYPSTLAIHSGRLWFAGSPVHTAIWGSEVTNIYSFATGAFADNAIHYDFQHGNTIQWLLSLQSLYLGDTEGEFFLRGQGVDKPLSGTESPYEAHIDQTGSRHVQPLLVDNAILLMQRLGQDIVQMRYSLNDSPDTSSFVSTELTLFARHIGDMGFSLHQPIYIKKPYSMCFFPLDNGQYAGLTFKPRQEVSAWSRTVTQGDFESHATVHHENGKKLTHYVIVKRVINGFTKRYIEYFEDDDPNLQGRVTDGVRWSALQTDSAGTGTILAGATTITGLNHLTGETVDVILNDNYYGMKVVGTGGVVTLNEAVTANTIFEVGLHFDSTLQTLRPNIQNEITEGLRRHWPVVFVRVKNTIGGKINNKLLKRQNDFPRMMNGLMIMENLETVDPLDGSLTITQTSPYPMTILGLAGKLALGDDQG